MKKKSHQHKDGLQVTAGIKAGIFDTCHPDSSCAGPTIVLTDSCTECKKEGGKSVFLHAKGKCKSCT